MAAEHTQPAVAAEHTRPAAARAEYIAPTLQLLQTRQRVDAHDS